MIPWKKINSEMNGNDAKISGGQELGKEKIDRKQKIFRRMKILCFIS